MLPMPTPESALFLAKKPKVPPTFDGVDYDDTPRLKAAQDAIIREQWVKSMMARLIRDELGKCYYREGVNHLEKCGALRGRLSLVWGGEGKEERDVYGLGVFADLALVVDRYFEALKDAKVRGYLFEQQNYIPEQGIDRKV